MAESKQYDLSVIFRVVDRASGALSGIGRKFKELVGPMEQAHSHMNMLAMKVQNLGMAAQMVGQNIALKLSLPLGVAGILATKKAIDFESAWIGVRKTVEATEPQFKALKKQLMDLALVVPLSTEEIMKIGEIAGQMGMSIELIPKFTKVIADLASSTDLTAEMGARLLAEFANITQMPKTPEMFEKLGSTINYLGNQTEASEKPIAEMAHRLASAGMMAKMSYANIVSIAAALSSLGLEAELGGTGFSRGLKLMMEQLGTGSKKIKGFASIAGYKSVKDFEKAWKENAAMAVINFIKGLAKLSAEGKNVEKIFDKLGMGGMHISDVLARAFLSQERFTQILQWGDEEWERNNSLTKEAAQRNATTASKLKMTKNAAEQMGSTFGDLVTPVLKEFLKEALEPLIQKLEKLEPTTKKIILGFMAFGAGLGPVVMTLSSLITTLGMVMMVWNPALAAFLASFGAISFALLGFGAGVLTVIAYWDDLKKAFSDDFWGSVGDMVEVLIGKLVNLISWLTGGIIPNFETWRNLVKSIWGIISLPIKTFREWMKEGREKGYPEIEREHWGGTHEFGGGFIGPQKSETDININISTDLGATATIEDVKRKRGDANVNASSLGYVGVW